MTRIGLLSDSHGRASTTDQAVQLLTKQGVDMLIHLGDIGTMEVVDALIVDEAADGSLKPEVHIVFGNTDWDARALGRYADELGIQVDHPLGELLVDGRRILFTHGDSPQLMQQGQTGDYLLHGHTHRPSDDKSNGPRVINPGALFRAERYTVAILEPASDRLTFFDVT